MKEYKTDPSESEIKGWKNQYGENLHCVEAGGKRLYYKGLKANDVKRRLIYARAVMFVHRNQVVEAGEVVFNELALGGDEGFKDNNSLEFLSITQHFVDLVGFLEVTSLPILVK